MAAGRVKRDTPIVARLRRSTIRSDASSVASMRWIERFALRAVMPAGGALPGVEATGLDAFLDRFHREAPLPFRVGLVAGGAMILLTPALTLRRLVPASWLSPEQLDQHVQRLAYHPIYPVRQALFAVKMVAGLCWGADPTVRAALGVAPLGPDPGTFRGDSSAVTAATPGVTATEPRGGVISLDAFRRWRAARR